MTIQQNQNASHIAVVGAGNMGSGIAQKYATHGYRVTVVDKFKESLSKSALSIDQSLAQGVKRQIFSEHDASAIKGHINFTTDLLACHKADLVIEAIFEDLELKQKLLSELDQICKISTVLATNTSSLKVGDVQRGLKSPERVLGLHYFFPPSKNRLVEIISSRETNAETVSRAIEWQKSIEKVVIRSNDSPGFIVNRFFVPWLNESMRIVHEGIANIATVDKACQSFFQISMGPFALMNATGLAITYHSCRALAQSLGEFYAPCPMIVEQVEKQAPWDLTGSINEKVFNDIAMRLLTVVSSISYQMVFQDQVGTMSDVDLGAKVGLLWKQGPFELAREHQVGIKTSLHSMRLMKRLLPDCSSFEIL